MSRSAAELVSELRAAAARVSHAAGDDSTDGGRELDELHIRRAKQDQPLDDPARGAANSCPRQCYARERRLQASASHTPSLEVLSQFA